MSNTSFPGAPQRFIPITSWNDHYDWPPLGGMRHLRFHSATNGFEKAFKRVGGRVLVDADAFWRIVEAQDARSSSLTNHR
jgi:hypothetical protein